MDETVTATMKFGIQEGDDGQWRSIVAFQAHGSNAWQTVAGPWETMEEAHERMKSVQESSAEFGAAFGLRVEKRSLTN